MKADQITPWHIGKRLRVAVPTGAVIEGTLRSLNAYTREEQDGRRTRNVLRTTVTFEEMKHASDYVGYSLKEHFVHTTFDLKPDTYVEEI